MTTDISPKKSKLMLELKKTRKIKVAGIENQNSERTLNGILFDLGGVESVRADSVSGRVSIEYDLMKIGLADIERGIVDAGYQLSQSFFSRKYRNLIHFIEGNEYESAVLGYSSNFGCGGCSLREKCG